MDIDYTTFLTPLKSQLPAQTYTTFHTNAQKKLWHQLTLATTAFAHTNEAKPVLVQLWNTFIEQWKKHANTLEIMQIAVKTAENIKDPLASIEFLKAQAHYAEGQKDGQGSAILAKIEAAHYHLRIANVDLTKEIIDECTALSDKLHHIEPSISAAIYRVSADYHKGKAAYTEFYKSALLYLSCVKFSELPLHEKQERAHDLAIAAVLSESLYNFGELLMHPILSSLVGSPNEWLKDLLFAFNSGNISKYEQLQSKFTPFLLQLQPFLQQKMCLMTLTETVFTHQGEQKCISFSEIAKATKLSLPEVEHLLMKALSIGLIRGEIDEVDSFIEVQWVQPRVLDKQQLSTVRDKLQSWSKTIRALADEMGLLGKDIFVS